MSTADNLNVFWAVLAGFLSFVSPCVLPLVPGYLGYMSGAVMQKGQIQAPRWHVLLHALSFVAGFTIIFTLLGYTAGALSDWLHEDRLLIQQIAGIILIIFGLHTIGVFQIPFLNYEKKFDVRPDPRLGYLRSLLIGFGFAVGWTPCVGVFLGSIYSLALNGDSGRAVPLFIAYSLGLGIPFILTALTLGAASKWLRSIMVRRFDLRLAGRTLVANLNTVSVISGVLLVVMGLLIFGDGLTILNRYLPQWTLDA